MDEQPYPLPRATRETEILAGDGGTIYGPFGFKVFDLEDLRVFVKHEGGPWQAAAFTAEKVAGAELDDFTVTFAAPLPATSRYLVQAARLHERQVAVTKGGAIGGRALEKELSKQGSVIDELRRDIWRGGSAVPGEPGRTLVYGPDGGVRPGADQSEIEAAQGYAEAAGADADRAEMAAGSAALYDPTLRYRTVADMIASTRASAGVGAQWLAGNFRYREADPASLDQHVTTAAGVKLYLAESEVDPLALRGSVDADDTASFAKALSFAKKIVLDPRHEYQISSTLTVGLPVKLDGRGAVVTTVPGFSGDNLLDIQSGACTLENVTLDGRYLPERTDDWVGQDFIGFTVKAVGTSLNPFFGNVLNNLRIIAGSTGALAAYYNHDLRVHNVVGYGAYTSDVYDTEAVLFFNQCLRGQYNIVKVLDAKNKGISWSNSRYFTAMNVSATTASADQAAIFTAGCAFFSIGGINFVGGYGVKMDTASDAVLSSVVGTGAGVAQGGLMLHGCQRVTVNGGDLRDFTDYGVAIGPHVDKGIDSTDITINDVTIRGNAEKGDLSAGYFLQNDSVYTNSGITINGGMISGVDYAITSSYTGTPLVGYVRMLGTTLQDIKTGLAVGAFPAFDFSKNVVYACPTLNFGVLAWTVTPGNRLVVCKNQVEEIGAAEAFLRVVGISGGSVKYNQIVFDGNTGRGGDRALYVYMAQSTDYINNLTAHNNSWFNTSILDAFYLSNLSDIDTQVAMTGNLLMAANNTKKSIKFEESAASGKWNGVVENNMADIVNKPNNI